MTPRPPIIGRTAAAVLAGALLVTACGSSDDGAAAAEEPSVADEAAAEGGEDAPVDVEIAETRPIEISGTPLPPYDSTVPDDAVGVTAPLIDGQSFDGTPITLGGESDGPRMLVFLAHWCPHCNDEIPELIELDGRGGLPTDLEVIGISTAAREGQPNHPPSEWIVDKGWPWPVLADDEASGAIVTYGGTGFPFTVLLDADGTVLARKSGSSPADAIEAWITENLS